MTLADILAGLFPQGHGIAVTDGLILGEGSLPAGGRVHVLGIADETALGAEGALTLAGRVLEIAAMDDQAPILMLIDSSSQRMSRNDELLGLSEYLAHLAKALLLAEAAKHRTVGLLYGGSAAGAFIAAALSTGTLVALPGAHPAVMDLASMARVTKLPLEVLKARAEATPVFAPGLDNLAKTGAIHAVWDPGTSLAAQLTELLASPTEADHRDRLGAERGGRPKAMKIAARVLAEVGHA